MRTTTKPTSRDRLDRRNDDYFPHGISGTITGGPMQKLDLLEILNRGTRGVTRGGAVSGSAQMIVSKSVSGGLEKAVALSDGTRISFVSIAEE